MTNREYDLLNDDMEDLHTVMINADRMQVSVGISSVIGRRQEQQDAVKADSDYAFSEEGRGIAVLCDGMGGLSGGERASKLCSEIVYNAFREQPDGTPISQFYAECISRADEAVSALKNDVGMPLNAGTTMVSIVVEDGKLHWASVGDSRIYIQRGGEIACLTRDHNLLMLLNEKVKRGEMTQAEADSDPKREALISYIGVGGVRYIDRNSRPMELQDGDHIILCSDGLYRTVTESEMAQIVRCFAGETESAAEALTQLALSKRNPHQDNTSVIVLEYRK